MQHSRDIADQLHLSISMSCGFGEADELCQLGMVLTPEPVEVDSRRWFEQENVGKAMTSNPGGILIRACPVA